MRCFLLALGLLLAVPAAAQMQSFTIDSIPHTSLRTEVGLLGIESANTPGKDQFGDAPWVTRDDTMFVQLTLKDNDGSGNSMCFEYARLNRRIGASRTLVFEYAVPQTFNQNWLWFSVPQVASDFGLAVGDTILWEWELQFSDAFCSSSHRNFYYIRTLVGEPLPTIAGWRRVDFHVHGYLSDDQLHAGMHYGLMASVGKSVGLDAIFVTDHSPNVTPTEWNTLNAKCAEYSRPDFLLSPGLELTLDDNEQNQNPDGRLHVLALGLTRLLPAPEECCTDNANLQLWTLRQALDSVAVQGGVAFAAHPTDGIIFPNEGTLGIWSQGNYDIGAVYPVSVFAGLEIFNERRRTFNYGAVTDDFIYPYGWQLNPNWDSRWQNGLNAYLSLIQRYLNPVRVVALGGSSDAHQAGYESYYEAPDDLGVYQNGLGGVHSLVYAPGPLNKGMILNGMKQGAVAMSDGPAAALFVDADGNGTSEGTIGGTFTLTTSGRLQLQAQSINEFGSFSSVRLIRVSSTRIDTTVVAVGGLSFATTIPMYNLIAASGWTAVILEARTSGGYRCVTSPVYLGRQGAVDVSPQNSTGLSLHLRPNPISASGNITLSLRDRSAIDLSIYDISGRLVERVFAGELSSGTHPFAWQRGTLPAGLYLLRCTTAERSVEQKFVLLH